MEHLGDAVAGRYLLVAPQPAAAARRQYHAVDMLADRTVTVRFEPLTPAHRKGMARLKTVDGHRVIDGGTFDGTFFVVVEGCVPVGSASEDEIPVALLEAMLAAPSAPEPILIFKDFDAGEEEDRAFHARTMVRNVMLSMIEIAGGVAIVVLLVAAAYLALGGVGERAPARSGNRPAAPPPGGAEAPAPAPAPVSAPATPGS